MAATKVNQSTQKNSSLRKVKKRIGTGDGGIHSKKTIRTIKGKKR